MAIGYFLTGSTLDNGNPLPALNTKDTYQGKVEIGKSGFHGAFDPYNALMPNHGNGSHIDVPLIHKVEYKNLYIQDYSRWASSERVIRATIDATHIIRRFVADQALKVSYLWDIPNDVREYLETLDEEKRPNAFMASSAYSSSAYAIATLSPPHLAWNAVRHAAYAETVAEITSHRGHEVFYRSWTYSDSNPKPYVEAKEEFNQLVYKEFLHASSS